MTPKKRSLIANSLFLLLCGLSCVLSCWLFVTVRMEDEALTKAADETIPKLTALNQQILTQLPPPAGYQLVHYEKIELRRSRDFITQLPVHAYGAGLITWYQFKGTSRSEIFPYYENLLLTQNWQQIWPKDDAHHAAQYLFQRGTACIRLAIDYGTSFIDLEIWHDFWSQDFSPPKPTGLVKKYLGWDDKYWMYFHCPDQNVFPAR